MKAKRVFENIDFRRGQKPRRALDIGEKRGDLGGVHEDIIFNGFTETTDDTYPKPDRENPSTTDYYHYEHRSGEAYINIYKYQDDIDLGFFVYLAIRNCGWDRDEPLDPYWVNNKELWKVFQERLYRHIRFHENLNFKRGIDPKRSLDIGYVKMMPEIARELEEEISLEIQMDVAIANYPGVASIATEYEGPVYVCSIGLESGHGLAYHEDRIATVSVFIDPFNLVISGEISTMDETYEGSENYHEIPKRKISDNEIGTMVRSNYRMYADLLAKANLETDE